MFERGDVKTDPSADYAGYVDELLQTTRTDNGVFGIKIMWKHLQKLPRNLDIPCAMQDHKHLARAVRTVFGRSHFLWSRRENKAKQAISFLKAKQTGLFTHQQEAQGVRAADTARLEFNFDAIHELVQRFEDEEAHWEKFFRLGRIRPLVVTYEDIADDYDGYVEKALRHVGVWDSTCQIKPPRRNQKLADQTSAEWLERYQTMLAGRKSQSTA